MVAAETEEEEAVEKMKEGDLGRRGGRVMHYYSENMYMYN